MHAATSCSRAPPRNSSATCRSGSSSTRSTNTSEGLDPRRLEALSDRTLGGARARVAGALGPRRRGGDGDSRRALSHAPCDPRAAGDARCDAGRSSSSSTTCTGPTPDRSSCWARSCAVRRRLRCCSPWPLRPHQVSGSPGGRPRAGPSERRADPPRAWRPEPAAKLGELLGPAVEGRAASALYEESGGNPFYLEQLARSLARPPAAPSDPLATTLADDGVPPAVAASLVEELGAPLEHGTPRTRRRRCGRRSVRARAEWPLQHPSTRPPR